MTSPTAETGERLIIRNELRVIDTVPLKGENLTVGRLGTCDIPLPHSGVSRKHARLERRGDGWHIVDNGSANGTRVNGRQVIQTRLVPGDVIEIRPFALNYVADDSREIGSSVNLALTCPAPTIARASGDVGAMVKRRLEELYALSRLVIHRKDDGSFWQDIHAALQRSLPADRCTLVGVDKAAGLFRLAPQARTAQAGAQLEISRSVLDRVIEMGEGLLIQHVADDSRFAGAPSLAGPMVGSVICVPVVVGGHVRAVVYADRRLGYSPFVSDDLDYVLAAVDLAATAVGMDELEARARELSMVRGRLDAAREMQEMLLPCPVPQPAWGQVAARNVPAQQMSGDIYDVAVDGNGRLVVSIADVAGKGVVAAFATAILQTTLRHALEHSEDLGEVMREINYALEAQSPTGSFATMILCRWSPDGRTVEVANAGHHAPLWLTATGKVDAWPECLALPLGVGKDWPGAVFTRDASSDLALVLSSDGATEARDPAGELYGLSRLGQKLATTGSLSADQLIEALLDDVRAFNSTDELADDITLLVAKRTLVARHM